MRDVTPIDRRRFVQALGAAATPLVAGCNGTSDEGETTEAGGDGDPNGDDATDRTATGTSTEAVDRPADTTEAGGTSTETEAAAGTGTNRAGETDRIELGGRREGWVGVEPMPIAGETNPTLTLEAGQTYELVWENLNGLEHELIVESADGAELVATESASEQGATRSVTFEATAEAAEYYCEYHPESMRGQVQAEPAGTGTDIGTATESAATASR